MARKTPASNGPVLGDQITFAESVVISVSAAELETMIERAVMNGMADAGLFLENDSDRQEARKDFNFIRSSRSAYEGLIAKIGAAVVLGLVAGFLYLVTTGIKAWTKL